MPELTDEQADLLMEEVTDVINELENGCDKFPHWPKNIFEQIAIIGEELGELQQAALQAKHEGYSEKHIRAEAVQVAAMGLRFLFEMRRKDDPENE